jgi:protoporphyrinogen oxidase
MLTSQTKLNDYIIVGAGFTGLALAFDLSRRGYKVVVLEAENEIGGLAGSFDVGGQKLEKFYHHWFNNDKEVFQIIHDVGLEGKIRLRSTNTSIYVANKFFKLSSPIDLLKFKALSWSGRIRLGLLSLRARYQSSWEDLESITASDWLKKLGGGEVYKVVWEPLLRGKFGDAADDISAVWIWNKLKLRGGSRGKKGQEQLAYFEGGFSKLADELKNCIEKNSGQVLVNSKVSDVVVENEKVAGVIVDGTCYKAGHVILTTPLPIIANLMEPHCSKEYIQSLRKIRYLANICIVLELNKSLSSSYWLNVNEPSFPFVAIIEHTNFEDASFYGGRHIVYLSKYLPEDDRLFLMEDRDVLEYCERHLRQMFPEFNSNWVSKFHVWRAINSQPIIEKNYSSLAPDSITPIKNLFVNTMAQIYPEDRGTNYAIREGRKMADFLTKSSNK